MKNVFGFTGTQKGLTRPQYHALAIYIQAVPWESGRPTLHHGDCLGADAQVHDIAWHQDWWIWIHPPLDPKKRAFKPNYNNINPPSPYLERNRNIVDICELLVACPKGPEELRSGTWSTVRYARVTNTPVIIIWPNGVIES